MKVTRRTYCYIYLDKKGLPLSGGFYECDLDLEEMHELLQIHNHNSLIGGLIVQEIL